MADREVKIKLTADNQQAKRAFKEVGDATTKASGSAGKYKESLGKLNTTLTRVATVGIAAFTVATYKSIQEASNFETRITDISTLISGDSTKAMADLEQGILDVAKRVPKSADELGASAYAIFSAGITDTTEALKVLEASGKLATAGLSTTEEATDLLTSAINVYSDETHGANELSEILFKTVKAGKTTVSELSQGFGKTAGIAKETGVSIEDLQASVAVLTTGGITASESYTALKAGLSNILKPTADAEAAAKNLGIKFNLGALQADGLQGLLIKVAEAADGDSQSLADLFGSTEAANAIMTLTSDEGAASMNDVLNSMHGEVGDLDEAFGKQTETFKSQIQLMKNELLPIFVQVGDAIINKVIPAIKGAIDFYKEHEEAVKVAIGIIGGLIGAIVLLKGALMIGGAIKTAMTALSLLGVMTTTTTGMVGGLSGALAALPLMITIGVALAGFALVMTQIGKLKTATGQMQDSLQQEKDMADKALIRSKELVIEAQNLRSEGNTEEADRLKAQGVKLFELSQQAPTETPDLTFFGNLDEGLKNDPLGLLKSTFGFADGGIVPGTGNKDTVPAMLTPGEIVLNKDQQKMLSGGQTININIDNVNASNKTDVNYLVDKIKNAMARENELAQFNLA